MYWDNDSVDTEVAHSVDGPSWVSEVAPQKESSYRNKKGPEYVSNRVYTQ